MSASRISPVRGSVCDGPIAKPTSAPRNQRTDAWRASSVSKSASSGCTLTTIAFVKPIRSNALFHSRMPSATVSRYATGTLRSIQKTIGCFGSDIAAVGSFFSRRQRLT